MSVAEEIEKLQALKDRGSLSEAEFASAKARILGEKSAPGNDSDNFLRQLRRSKSDRIIGGVCGGLGRSTGLPTWCWRILFCLAFLGFGVGVLLYVLLWLFVPEES